MNIVERLGAEQSRDWRGELENAVHTIEQLQESMAQLELSREDAGWERLSETGKRDMSREAIIKHAELHRVMVIANPLIRRGAYLSAAYTVGEGVGTTANHTQVNAIVQEFLDDPKIRQVWAGANAKERSQIARATDGNIFYALPTNLMTGEVTIRKVPMDEITRIITAPGDRETVQYYLRQWSERDPVSGEQVQRKVVYPELRHRPITRQKRLRLSSQESAPIQWDTPIYHAAFNKLDGMDWGIADAFSAVPWARGYSEFLSDWAKLMKALARIAYKTRSSKNSHSQQMRAEAQKMGNLPAGSTAVLTGDSDLEPMPKTGATIDSESARPLATMVAAAFGIPVTTLLSDPGQTGARAVAETLALPTRLIMESRREDDREERRAILEYKILQEVKAPRGRLRRLATVQRFGDTERAVFHDDTAATLTIDYPELDDTPIETLMAALASADATGKVPPLVILERILRALRVRDVDEILRSVTDEQGNFIPPQTTVDTAAGRAATNALRRGGNPADHL